MKKILLTAVAVCALSGEAKAQNPQCPTRPPGDSTNACASTAFVTRSVAAGTGLIMFTTRSAAIGTMIDASAKTVLVEGFATAGDAPLAAYKRIPCAAAVPWGFQSVDKIDANGAVCTGTNINWLLNEPVVYAQQLGAKCIDGTPTPALDTPGLQNAINAGIAINAAVKFYGNCNLNAVLTINSSLDFSGVFGGYGISIVQGHGTFTTGAVLSVPADTNAIIVDTPKPVVLHDFAMSSGGTNGTAITFTATQPPPNGYLNQGSIVYGIYAQSFGQCFWFMSAAGWQLYNSTTVNCNIGLRVSDTFNPDGGDSSAYGNTFSGGGLGVLFESSGGLKFFGNKINSPTQDCFRMLLAAGAVTSILNINGNSIEGCGNDAIAIARAGTTGSFHTVNIVGNHLRGLVGGIHILHDATGVWLTNVVISGNNVSCGTVCVDVDSAANGNIEGNNFNYTGSGSGTPLAIQAGASNFHIGVNTTTNFTNTNFVAGTLVTEDPIRSLTTPSVSSCGTGAGAGGSSAGGQITIGSGTTSCTFSFGTPSPYKRNVFCTLSNLSTGVGVVYSAPTLTGFTITGGIAVGNLVGYVCSGI